MGKNSETERLVDWYMGEELLTEEEARERAFFDSIGRVFQAGVGGALSGGTMGGVKAGIDYRSTGRRNEQTLTSQKGHGAGDGGGSIKNSEPIHERTIDFGDGAAIERELNDAQTRFFDLTHEECITVTSDGKVWRAIGGERNVDTRPLQDAGSSLVGSYSYHNHPSTVTYYSFSANDVKFFFEVGEEYSRASDDVFEYVMRCTPKTVDVDSETAYSRFMKILNGDVLKLSFDGKIDFDQDGYHETMKRLSKEYGFIYGRRRLNGG